MPKGSGGSGSSKQSVEGDPDMGIRAPGSTLPVISEGSKNSAIVMAALVNDFEAIQSVVRLQGDPGRPVGRDGGADEICK